MKRNKWSLIIVGVAMLSGTFCQAQELVENKIDEFTHDSVKRTSWELLKRTSISNYLNVYTRLSKVNQITLLDLKAIPGKMPKSIFVVKEGSELMLKCENDSVISLANLKYTMSCTGCGAIGLKGSAAEGIAVSYPISPSQLEYLKKHKVVKLRIYTTDGYLESEVSPSCYNNLNKCISLIQP